MTESATEMREVSQSTEVAELRKEITVAKEAGDPRRANELYLREQSLINGTPVERREGRQPGDGIRNPHALAALDQLSDGSARRLRSEFGEGDRLILAVKRTTLLHKVDSHMEAAGKAAKLSAAEMVIAADHYMQHHPDFHELTDRSSGTSEDGSSNVDETYIPLDRRDDETAINLETTIVDYEKRIAQAQADGRPRLANKLYAEQQDAIRKVQGNRPAVGHEGRTV